MNIINYITDHWSHITAAAFIVINHGGIKTLGLSLWNGKPKQPTPENPASTQPKV